jgi:putative peptidoglycan lipid II flippase
MNSLLVGPFGHVGLAFSTSTVALVNFLFLALFMRRRLGRLGGRQLAITTLKIALASAALALVAWVVDQGAGALPLDGLTLELARVIVAIVVAGATFYLFCRLLQVNELQEAIDAIGGKFVRRFTRR